MHSLHAQQSKTQQNKEAGEIPTPVSINAPVLLRSQCAKPLNGFSLSLNKDPQFQVFNVAAFFIR